MANFQNNRLAYYSDLRYNKIMIEDFVKKYHYWQYKNTAILILSLALFFIFADTPFVKELINKIGDFGYLSAFVSGILFVSIFTVAPAAVIIFDLAQKLNSYEVAVLAGAGAVIGDYLIFRFLKDRVFQEMAPIFRKSTGFKKINQLFQTPYFSWLIPIFGAILIASPAPDEVGIGMLGLSKIKNWQFILITFVLNAVGIFVIISLAILR